MSVASYHERFMAAAEIGRAERVLDIGCGTGQTTRDAARAALQADGAGGGSVGPMIALARRLAAEQGVADAIFEQTDAQIHPSQSSPSMWRSPAPGPCSSATQVAAFANIARAPSVPAAG